MDWMDGSQEILQRGRGEKAQLLKSLGASIAFGLNWDRFVKKGAGSVEITARE